ncbi:hypothetical protein [Nocardioides marmorisolisilvae]|uniref:Uncharacterized protein n=1 Tax=Nocardioides marmorisolisilvae TaxID=1542737 RepID=A0A3N0E0N5_9ACTN|nr:hypothetical protein [Nocardioides marmorisolisilvae]RNL81370.1 hypothetical protein EFL95_03220 [Nocardioides marmorisolisilvae]
MREYLKTIPIGAWAGLVIIALGLWARDILGVALGGILAVVSLIATDRARAAEDEDKPGEDITKDDRFKDM